MISIGINNISIKKLMFLLLIAALLSQLSFSQTVGFPILNLANNSIFQSKVTMVENLPFYLDNLNERPTRISDKDYGDTPLGLSITNTVPTICNDDFRDGFKFENSNGEDGFGFLSVLYWLPSNGDYMLLLCGLENGMDYYREFLVTTTPEGQCIDYLLVHDGFYEEPHDVNFVQCALNNDMTISRTEIKMFSSTYVSCSEINTFQGQRVDQIYNVNSNGNFVLTSTNPFAVRSFNVTELKGMLNNL
jgi:hypothetical protein